MSGLNQKSRITVFINNALTKSHWLDIIKSKAVYYLFHWRNKKWPDYRGFLSLNCELNISWRADLSRMDSSLGIFTSRNWAKMFRRRFPLSPPIHYLVKIIFWTLVLYYLMDMRNLVYHKFQLIERGNAMMIYHAIMHKQIN